MRKLALFILACSLLSLSSAKTEDTRYVPFLERDVPVAQLQQRVRISMDASRESFGIDAIRQEYGLTGAGAEVCVIDTGVDPAHEQLDSKTIDFFDAVNGRSDSYDDHGHGTFVAAQVAGDGVGGANAAAYEGVAPEATISAAKVLNVNGSGTYEQVIEGVEWCATRESVDIISMSLGGPQEADDPLEAAVNRAVTDYGKVVVVAAGNSGGWRLGTVLSPGAAAQAITVGAGAEWTTTPADVNFSAGPYLAPFSSRGPTLDGRIKPDVIAPGVTVTGADSGTSEGYVTWSGTSMATPFTAGVVALMLEQNPSLSPSQVKDALTSTALDQGFPGQDNDYGWGYLNPPGALGLDDDVFPRERLHWVATTWDSTTITVDESLIGGRLVLTAVSPDANLVRLAVESPSGESWVVEGERAKVFDLIVYEPGTYKITALNAPVAVDAWLVAGDGPGERELSTWYLHGYAKCDLGSIPRRCLHKSGWTVWVRIGTGYSPCSLYPKCQSYGVTVVGHWGRRTDRPVSCVAGSDAPDATCQINKAVRWEKKRVRFKVDELRLEPAGGYVYVYNRRLNEDVSGDATPSGTVELAYRPEG